MQWAAGSGLQVETPDDALHRASASGDLEAIAGLLAGGWPIDFQPAIGDQDVVGVGCTALMAAILCRQPDAVRLLLESGADANLGGATPDGKHGAVSSPMSLAIEAHCVAYVELLLSHGADPGLACAGLANAHRFAMAELQANESVLGADSELRLILEKLEPWKGAGDLAEALSGETALMMAARDGKAEDVAALLQQPDVDVNAGTGLNITALMCAMGGPTDSPDGVQAQIASALLDAGAEVNALTNDGQCTALSINALTGRSEVTRVLLSARADLNMGGNKQTSAVLQAAICEERHGRGDATLRMLLNARREPERDPARSDSLFVSQAMAVSVTNGWLGVLRTLVGEASDCVNLMPDVNGATPLMVSAALGKVDAMGILLDGGASLDLVSVNPDQRTALGYAQFHGQAECEALLRARGATDGLGASWGGSPLVGSPLVASTVREARLKKAGGFMGKQWQERQVVLKSDRTLDYYYVRREDGGRVALDLAGSGIVRCASAGKSDRSTFKVMIKRVAGGSTGVGEEQTLKFKTENASDAYDWIMALNTLCLSVKDRGALEARR